jgi:hypothetical protein
MPCTPSRRNNCGGDVAKQIVNAVVSVCANAGVVQVCAATDKHGNIYFAYGFGIGIPGGSASLIFAGKTNHTKLETGMSATIDGSVFLGGGITFTSAKKTPIPSLEIGSPGAGFFIMYGKKLRLW